MKVSPQNYAKALIASLDQTAECKRLAKDFWHLLQKNGQYKDLSKILSELDKEIASQHNMVLTHVYSDKLLSSEQLSDIESKIQHKYGKKAYIRNIQKQELISGIIIKVDDVEIDLSVAGKVNRLKKQLSQE
ncbi:MAG: F0F1 ATP synthase subunit delta [bacterium ADurb.Bin400]|nr:MAG: F0F1 ATP synthase subunit delta [bacterium ADurb.Bin400]